MDSTSKIVVLEVRGFVQAVLAAPSGKCRVKAPTMRYIADLPVNTCIFCPNLWYRRFDDSFGTY